MAARKASNKKSGKKRGRGSRKSPARKPRKKPTYKQRIEASVRAQTKARRREAVEEQYLRTHPNKKVRGPNAKEFRDAFNMLLEYDKWRRPTKRTRDKTNYPTKAYRRKHLKALLVLGIINRAEYERYEKEI